VGIGHFENDMEAQALHVEGLGYLRVVNR
jgi:hypothetical protein